MIFLLQISFVEFIQMRAKFEFHILFFEYLLESFLFSLSKSIFDNGVDELLATLPNLTYHYIFRFKNV
jgi:hypothetical protein